MQARVLPAEPILGSLREGVTQDARVTPSFIFGLGSHKSSHTPFSDWR
jgi:hypothetical protein